MCDIIAKLKFLIKDGFLHIFYGSILIKLMGLFSNMLVIRFLSKEAYGNLAYADNLYSYVTILTGLGMSTAIIIKCGKGEENDYQNFLYFKFSITRGAVVQFLGSVAILLYFFVFSNEFQGAKNLVLLLFFYPTIVYLTQCCTSYIRAYQENKLYSKVAVTQSFFLAFFSICLSYIIGSIGVIVARYIAVCSIFVVSYSFFHKKVKCIKLKLSKNDKTDYLKVSIALLLGSMFSELMLSNEMLLVNKLISDEVITANYKVATLLPMQIYFVTQSLLIYFMPKFVELREDREHLWRYVCKVSFLNFALVLLVCLIAIIFTPWFIKTVYGIGYVDSISLSIKFWIAYGLSAAIRVIPLNVLASTGYEKLNSIFSIFGCGIHFIVSWAILKYVGLNWLPLAIMLVYFIVGVLAWFFLYRSCWRRV